MIIFRKKTDLFKECPYHSGKAEIMPVVAGGLFSQSLQLFSNFDAGIN